MKTSVNQMKALAEAIRDLPKSTWGYVQAIYIPKELCQDALEEILRLQDVESKLAAAEAKIKRLEKSRAADAKVMMNAAENMKRLWALMQMGG